jgi:hypothetical protein
MGLPPWECGGLWVVQLFTAALFLIVNFVSRGVAGSADANWLLVAGATTCSAAVVAALGHCESIGDGVEFAKWACALVQVVCGVCVVLGVLVDEGKVEGGWAMALVGLMNGIMWYSTLMVVRRVLTRLRGERSE